jgi:hypothetical protein
LGTGGNLRKTWTFDLGTKQWELMYKGESVNPDSGDGPGYYMQTCTYDSVTRKVFYACDGGTYTYEYDANVWTKINTARSTASQGSLVDYQRHRFVRLGADGSNWDHHVAVYDLTKPGYPKVNHLTTGANNILTRDAVGAEYDPVADKYVCWRDSNVYSLDPDTWVWTQHSRNGAPATTPNGVYGRWRYIPHVNAYICVTAHDQNVHFYKLTAGGAAALEQNRPAPICRLRLQALPNPFNPSTRLAVNGLSGVTPCRIAVYTPVGKKVYSAEASVTNGTAIHVWEAQSMAAGLYVAVAEQDGRRVNSAVMLAK